MVKRITELYQHLFILMLLWISVLSEETEEFCSVSASNEGGSCGEESKPAILPPRFIFYDVNPPEGFNLRRDVYMRMAVLARKLKKLGDWYLVLPPWGRIYHWQSADVGKQHQLPWSLFFDVPSLRKFAPVMDMNEYLSEHKSTEIDEVYVLQHYKDDWESGKWEEKYGIEPCNEKLPYSATPDGSYTGRFWGYNNFTAKQVRCLSFHGHVSQLKGLLKKTKARLVMVDHAEVALHDSFGDKLYWKARRSMRFAKHLVEVATDFRRNRLNSSDEADGVVRPTDWTKEKPRSGTLGGPYMCVHLRRKDFLWGRSKEVPSLESAAEQLRDMLLELYLDTLFVATDAPVEEFIQLQLLLSEFTVVRYEPSQEVRLDYKDGGLAIIEQIICSHSRHFVGTHESTFSFRIQEEREIMGFSPESTFNRLCGTAVKCEPPSKWRIVF
ncbi:GDP-fucose protein O-fucosyltransferase 2 [Anabrus simplex]|uniref:GDP-fucose protein O-fucosyltransferase 2 n=1 Tax=Anabrus simplex TaxID=316456 RepID=UPI0034DCE1CA